MAASLTTTRLGPRSIPTPAPVAGDGSRTLAALLMAAVLAALLVVAEQLIDGWTDGHLMLAWVLLWCTAFSALALLARPLRILASRTAQHLSGLWAAYQQQLAEEAMWEYAKGDRRVMQEIQLATLRQTQGQ